MHWRAGKSGVKGQREARRAPCPGHGSARGCPARLQRHREGRSIATVQRQLRARSQGQDVTPSGCELGWVAEWLSCEVLNLLIGRRIGILTSRSCEDMMRMHVKTVIWWKMLCFYIIILTLSPVLRRCHSQGLDGETLRRFLSALPYLRPPKVFSKNREKVLWKNCELCKNWNKFNY